MSTQGTLEKKVLADGAWVPESDAERSTIHEQLNRILANPLFKNSKRYPKMLRFVVEQSLGGHTEHLKERTLGVEVFGRDPDYNTNLDPIVRITAGEIRKRIAQYYHEPGHEAEIRIDFPPGSYIPEFHKAATVPVATAPVQPATLPRRRAGIRLVSAGLALGVVAVLLMSAQNWLGTSSALDRFWAPVLNTPDPVLIYIGASGLPESNMSLKDLHATETVGYADAKALADVTSFLVSRHKPLRTGYQALGKLDELKDGPAVLIGAFNNSWTLRLTDQLRFRFRRDKATDTSWIQDRENPQSRQWSHVMTAPYTDLKEDYAIVSRVLDPTTGRLVVTAAGLAKFGTAAAGEFLTNPSFMEQIDRSASKNWDRKNIEIVLATSVVGLSSGPPHILAVHCW